MSDCDVSAGGNFTDEDYVNHLNGKLEEKVESLEADNALLKSENTRYEKHNKTLKNELNIWNESPLTEKVRELTAKVKELEDILATYRHNCVTCKRSVEPDECYSLEGTDIMACSEKCLDAYED